MNIRAYEEGFGSVERVAIMAADEPERQLRAVEMLIGELAGAVTNGELAVTDWADRVHSITQKTGMIEAHGQDCIQSMMSAAIRAAARPSTAKSPIGTWVEETNGESQRLFCTETELVVRCASEIEPKAIDWLWP
jgi:hypothetical protein